MSDSILSLNDFIAGWISGIAGIIIGHPADTIKVIQQTTGSNIITATTILFRKDGFSALFRGMSFPLLTTGVINSVFFGVYGNSLRFIEKYEQKTPEHQKIERGYSNIFISGCVGGFAQAFLANPVELIKINLQTHVLNDKGKPQLSPFRSALEIIQKNGFKGLYHGFGALLIRDLPASGLYVFSYDIFTKQFDSVCHNPTLDQLLAGGLAVNYSGLLTPTSKLKFICLLFCRLKSIAGIIIGHPEECRYNKNDTTMIGSNIITALFRGMLFPLLTGVINSAFLWDVLMSGTYMLIYTGCLLKNKNPESILSVIFAGGITGVLSWILVLPVDVIKTRLQSDDTHNPKYRGIIDCFRKTIKEDIRVFGKGFWIVVTRAFPVNGVIFLTYDLSLNYLNRIHK